MDPVEALRRLGGVAEYGELIGPCTRRQLERAVRSGSVIRLRRGRYALVDLDSHRLAAQAVGGYLSHLSAALHWGWRVKHTPSRPCVTLPRGSRKPSTDLALHWASVADGDVHNGATTRARTVIDCARTLPLDEALCVADSALREGIVDRHELTVCATRAPRTGRARALTVIGLADPRAANPFESVLRATALDVPGLALVPQGHVPGVGWVDLLDATLSLVVEADSFEFHASRAQLRRDVRRYTDCARQGLTVVRFTWEEVMFDPDRVRDSLADVAAWARSRSA